MIPFIFAFEKRKPALREIVIISVLCGIAIAGRAAFAMLPQFKPVLAVVIISAICFGAETGFLVGAITAFVSNFFFGQGPWTPWQMFAFGIIGFIGGIIFTRGILKATKINLSYSAFFGNNNIRRSNEPCIGAYVAVGTEYEDIFIGICYGVSV